MKYEYNGQYNETMATLDDGRVMIVNTQYSVVTPTGTHAATCELKTKMGGRCTCGMLDGVDVVALVADARKNGKFGIAPVAPVDRQEFPARLPGLCPRCNTFCCGDCESR